MERCSFTKQEVLPFVVWLGGRLYDHSDLDACRLPGEFLGYPYPFTSMENAKGFGCAVKKAAVSLIDRLWGVNNSPLPAGFMQYLYPFTERRRGIDGCRGVLREADNFIVRTMKQQIPLAVFVVATWGVIEFAQKHKLNRPYRPEFPLLASLIPSSQEVFSYLIIMDGGKYWNEEEKGPYSENEKMAHKVGGVFLGYNTDAPTAGGRRLAEFMSRIMGHDLEKTELFPQYDFETLKKMAWHIDGENFNSWGPKEGAIPKYTFDQNGRPIFDPCLNE